MMLRVGDARHLRVSGELRVLGDKSISHRALLLAALARGRSTVHGVLRSGDTESTARVLRALGADLTALGPTTIIEGRGLRGLTQAAASLDCGNSGTTARLLLGILAAQPFAATLVGDASLSRRPMRRVAEPLRAMGATIDQLESHDGLPLTITGGDLQSIEWSTPVASAQIKSAILLAGLCGSVPVTVQEPQRSRDHSERMLASLGVEIQSQTVAGAANRVSLVPTEGLPAFELTVPGDPSSAAYFVALGTLAGAGEVTLREIALNPTRIGFIDVLRRMGADIVVDHGEALGELVGDVRVRAGRPLVATTIEAHEVPSLIDEIPLLACVAVCAAGETIIHGAGELRVKESDRIAAIVSNLRTLGVSAEELPDGMRINGAAGTRLRGTVRAFQDHRIAMAFATLGAATGAELEIDDPSCVAISYPEFWHDLARLTGA